MAKPGNKNNKARCEKYKQTGRRLINKQKKAEKHEKRMRKFAERREAGKSYEYTPNPYKKGSKEYIEEENLRSRKNGDHSSPVSVFDSMMRKAKNYSDEQKMQEKKIKEVKQRTED